MCLGQVKLTLWVQKNFNLSFFARNAWVSSLNCGLWFRADWWDKFNTSWREPFSMRTLFPEYWWYTPLLVILYCSTRCNVSSYPSDTFWLPLWFTFQSETWPGALNNIYRGLNIARHVKEKINRTKKECHIHKTKLARDKEILGFSHLPCVSSPGRPQTTGLRLPPRPQIHCDCADDGWHPSWPRDVSCSYPLGISGSTR